MLGDLLRYELDGVVTVKSYMVGIELAISLAPITLRSSSSAVVPSPHTVVLDDAVFHDLIDVEAFEENNMLCLEVPTGELSLMNYRICDNRPTENGYLAGGSIPFTVFSHIETPQTPNMLEISMRLRSDLPERFVGQDIRVQLPVPACTRSVSSQFSESSQSRPVVVHHQSPSMIEWNVGRLRGGSEIQIKMKLTLSEAPTPAIRRAIGPISLRFEVSDYLPSGFSIRKLSAVPSRGHTYSNTNTEIKPWIRNITRASSYVVRI
ncbi:hypothetical protein H696_04259 [Fonticula alba]|uniref:MHD domain-containing protein n=1 Tax=Fonticula alba TaxID=691883 RepID=A0A058Z3X5_FONAL|nr:hypothetical protein H696_04259 [Fonticula alba]KCV68841.1 hypothetical protein H696_04259 [Fonticula alba]|eukprot:XP_009496412.1 hypothetical protein H696_04259 [Fonticula alba]